MKTVTCCNCGTRFGMSDSLHQLRRDDCKTFYCPSGHPQSYRTTKADRLLESERNMRHAAQNRESQLQLSNRALRGHLTRLRK